MAFTDPLSLKQRGAGMAGALIIPGALGALFISSLAVTGVVTLPPIPRPQGVNIPLPPPPPPPETDEKIPDTSRARSTVVVPVPPIDVGPRDLKIDTTPIIPEPIDTITRVVLPPLDIRPSPGSGIKPLDAVPRNNPRSWVTADDYRSSWINRELTGSAKFDLAIAPNGRVTGCRITQSTGHEALDQATCSLIAKRARFTPATDAAGKPVAGSYSSSIRWVLPD